MNVNQIRLIVFDEQDKFVGSFRSVAAASTEFFNNISSCLSFLESSKETVVVVTTSADGKTLEAFQQNPSVESIFLLSTTSKSLDTFPSKVFGVYPSPDLLLRPLQELLGQIDLQLTLKSFICNFRDDDQDEPSFYFYYLWKTLVKTQIPMKTFLDRTRSLFPTNSSIRPLIDQFEDLYKPNEVAHWLDRTRRPFPFYSFIYDALRNQNEPFVSLSKMLLDDLQKLMKPTGTGSSENQVFLGIQLPNHLIERFEKCETTQVIGFQCFLPVTKSRAAALLDATRSSRRSDRVNVLFKINLNGAPAFTQADSVLVDLATPFRVLCVTRSSGTNASHQSLIVIKLLALDKTERERLFNEFLQRQQQRSRTAEGIFRKLCSKISDEEEQADVCIERGQWLQASKFLSEIPNPSTRIFNKLGSLYREHLNDPSTALKCHKDALAKAEQDEKGETMVLIGLCHQALKKYDDAFQTYSKALKLLENTKEKDLKLISRCYLGMGNAKKGLDNLEAALEYTEQSLAIREHQIQPRNDYEVATCLSNIGNILHQQSDFQRAIVYTSRAVELFSVCAPNDPRLAATLNNLGGMHQSIGQFDEAEQYFQRALHVLPDENHPYRESTKRNLIQNQTRKSVSN